MSAEHEAVGDELGTADQVDATDEHAVADLADATDEHAAEFARLVDEGVLIVGAALRMRVKNQIVVRILAQASALTSEDYDRIVLDATTALIAENTSSVEYLARQSERAQRRRGSAQHMSDYRAADVESLDLRRRVAEALSSALETMCTRPEYREPIIERARSEAMLEMFRARMPTSISAEEPATGPEHDERMRLLIADLLAQVRAHDPAEPVPESAPTHSPEQGRQSPDRPWRWFRGLWR